MTTVPRLLHRMIYFISLFILTGSCVASLQAQVPVASATSSADITSSASDETLKIPLERSDQTLETSENQIQTWIDELNAYQVALTAEQNAFLVALEAETKVLAQKKEELKALDEIKFVGDAKQLSQNYARSVIYWNEAMDDVRRSLHSQAQSQLTLADEPAQPEFLTDAGASQYQNYLNLRNQVLTLQNKIDAEKKLQFDLLKANKFKLLNEARLVRVSLLKACDQTSGCVRPTGLDPQHIQGILREFRAVPLRAEAGLAAKWVEVKTKVKSGLQGVVDLTTQFFILSLIIAVPFVLRRLLLALSQWLENTRHSILVRSTLKPRHRTLIALTISRFNPFIPSLGMILNISVAQQLIGATDLKEFSSLLTYLLIYYFYQAARLLIEICLEIVFSTRKAINLNERNLEISKSSRRIAAIIFIEYAVLQLIQDTIRAGLIHNLITTNILWFNLLFLIWETRRWRQIIADSFAARFDSLWRKIEPLYQKRVMGSLVTPLLFVAIAIHDLAMAITVRLMRIDSMKKILSEVFRRRINLVVKNITPTGALPADYLAQFSYFEIPKASIFIKRKHEVFTRAQNTIAHWLENKAKENVMVIVADRGGGKTTTLQQLHTGLAPSVHKTFSTIDARLLGADNFYDYLSGLLGQRIQSAQDFQRFDKNLSAPVVLFIDHLHNLFLNQIGGFAAYHALVELLNSRTQNIFWCLAINLRPWTHLRGVFSGDLFYGKILQLPPWQDYEIQELILSRHNQTGFKRTFDSAISTYSSEAAIGQEAETQYFRLLWGQSRGNPRSALMYWISAVSLLEPQHIHVGVPVFFNSNVVSELNDSTLFLLAAVARHASLTLDEMAAVTQMSPAIIQRSLKEAINKDLLWQNEEGRVWTSGRAQYSIDYFLIGKNFLYE